MTSMPQEFKINFEYFGYFRFFNPFEILSDLSNLYSSRWFREDVQWIIDKVFSEKLMF